MEQTLALLGRAHQGDKEARDTIFQENTGLVWSVARRFSGRGVELEDLFQIGCIGLLKAVDKFDVRYEVRFSTYAVPMITGEIRRFLRDDGLLKVSRTLKETNRKAYQIRRELEKQLGKEPGMEEVAAAMGIPVEELVFSLDSNVEIESLSKPIYQGDGNEISLIEKIPQKENPQEETLNRIFLEEMLGKLEGKERSLLYMRYYQEKTQSEIAKVLGISQVQVSRMEKRILERIRKMLDMGQEL